MEVWWGWGGRVRKVGGRVGGVGVESGRRGSVARGCPGPLVLLGTAAAHGTPRLAGPHIRCACCPLQWSQEAAAQWDAAPLGSHPPTPTRTHHTSAPQCCTWGGRTARWPPRPSTWPLRRQRRRTAAPAAAPAAALTPAVAAAAAPAGSATAPALPPVPPPVRQLPAPLRAVPPWACGGSLGCPPPQPQPPQAAKQPRPRGCPPAGGPIGAAAAPSSSWQCRRTAPPSCTASHPARNKRKAGSMWCGPCRRHWTRTHALQLDSSCRCVHGWWPCSASSRLLASHLHWHTQRQRGVGASLFPRPTRSPPLVHPLTRTATTHPATPQTHPPMPTHLMLCQHVDGHVAQRGQQAGW